jgi:hypothetical protein
MQRAALVTALFLAACTDGGSSVGPDALGDVDNTGSGSNAAMFGFDPSPPDVTLEWMVIGLSVIVIGSSVRSRRRVAKTFEL